MTFLKHGDLPNRIFQKIQGSTSYYDIPDTTLVQPLLVQQPGNGNYSRYVPYFELEEQSAGEADIVLRRVGNFEHISVPENCMHRKESK